MNAMNIQEASRTEVWTRQVPDVLEELRTAGRYRVQEAYIREKNGSIADYYLKLYRWFTGKAAAYLPVAPEGYPIWLSLSDEMRLRAADGTVVLKLKIPSEKLLLCNYDAWGYVVNYFYVPMDETDEARHRAELGKYGIGTDDELILTAKGNFYPLLKRKVEKSWERIFTLPPRDPQGGLVAVCWELRGEWIEEVQH